jgi:hypothetical protein
LVILRQLQAWASRKTWALAVSLYVPGRIAAVQTQPIAHFLYAGAEGFGGVLEQQPDWDDHHERVDV